MIVYRFHFIDFAGCLVQETTKKIEDVVRVIADNLSSSGENNKEKIRAVIKNQIETLKKLS
jgi:hypothetical protein